MTDPDWECIFSTVHFPTGKEGDSARMQFAREINTTIFLAEEGLRKAIATDLRSLGFDHPELAAWAETLACRYAKGEESK
jgi:hypothetical protein